MKRRVLPYRATALFFMLATMLFPACKKNSYQVFVDPLLPAAAQDKMITVFSGPAPVFIQTQIQNDADIVISPTREKTAAALGTWYFALAAPMAVPCDGVTKEELYDRFKGHPLPPPFGTSSILVDETTKGLVEILSGTSQAPGIGVTDDAHPADEAWRTKTSPVLIPFDRLTPDLRVLEISGLQILFKSCPVDSYPLAIYITADGDTDGISLLKTKLNEPLTNRDLSKLTSVCMTGVTALTRMTAQKMDEKGVLYPAEAVAGLLQSADITHLSNEVSFSPDCKTDPSVNSLLFCSHDRFFALFEYVGADVIELTGNHLLDDGTKSFLHSLDLYAAAGMKYFGGGRNLDEARRPVIITHNGNRLAFLGACAGPSIAYAGISQPGPLRFDLESLAKQVRELRQAGMLPIVCIQHWEVYQYAPTANQRAHFRALIDAGALIVQGSQAHQPQGFELYGGGFIHYGPGNLFFDQMWSLGTREVLIDTHYIYENRHISTIVHTALLEDYCRPRPTMGKDRDDLLDKVFQESVRNGRPF